ncbi:family 16 glycosylhydrolase [Novipirellula herctigrandis]
MISVCLESTADSPKTPKHGNTEKRMDLTDWELVWQDEFDYPNERLDENWESQNSPSHHILCSRWRENAVVKNGILHLINKKENRGGQEWTSGSVWSKKKFKYGYFECRYRYAEATGTNNSFWLMTRGSDPAVGKRFEIDINEGHYPNEVNTNIHNWTDVVTHADGTKTHPSAHEGFAYGMRPDYSLPLEIPVTTKRLRLTSTTSPHFHIREFRIFGVSNQYPDALSETADRDLKGLVNHARDPSVQIEASGVFNDKTKPEHAADGTWNTSWISHDDGEKWLEFRWPRPITVGCIQFINGWQSKGEWTGWGQVSNYRIQAHDGRVWKEIATMDSKDAADFGANYHTYGMLWTEDEIVFYQDRKELRRVANEFCKSESPIWLSEAIIRWAGSVSDQIDGTSMKVDWVRYYQKGDSQ